MIHPDDDMEKHLARFRRRPAPEGLKARVLAGSRRRIGEESGRFMTPRLWLVLAVEGLTLLFLLFFAPGKSSLSRYTEIFAAREAADIGSASASAAGDIAEEVAGLSDAEKARLVRGLSRGRAGEPRSARFEKSRYSED